MNIKKYLILGIFLISVALALKSEFQAILAWWLSIILLAPTFLWALKTKYVALKTICGVSFVTQLITIPFFFIQRDEFPWGHVKPFTFTALESLPILGKIFIFMIIFILSFKLLYLVPIFGGTISKLKKQSSNLDSSINIYKKNKLELNILSKNRNTNIYSFIIIILIPVLIAINFWSYSKGIGLTGIEPPALPYKISGILFYLMKYVTPAILGLLYFKTKRGWFLMILFLTYSWIIGLSSISKGVVLFIMFPVVLLAWLDRRKIMFVFASIGTLIGVTLAAESRNYIYVFIGEKSGADTTASILEIAINIFSDPNSQIWRFDFIPHIIGGIMSRIEGFGNLVMAQFYDPYAVDGPLQFILRIIWNEMAHYDTDLHSIQWQGNTLPEGFYNGGALLSTAVIVGNASLLWTVLSAVVTAMILVTLEKSIVRISTQFIKFKAIGKIITFGLTMIFFSTSGGDITFVYPFILILLISLLTPLFHHSKYSVT
jgi:hypothetical protein